jgi:hypothetical protein
MDLTDEGIIALALISIKRTAVQRLLSEKVAAYARGTYRSSLYAYAKAVS